MTEAIPNSQRDLGWRALLVILLIVAGISRFSHFFRAWEGDGAVFIYMGKIVAEGGRFGTDVVDNKFPTVGLMASFCWRIFGAWWPAYVLLAAAMSAVATWALTRAARENFDKHAADATMLFAIVYLNFSWIVWIFGGFQLETPLAMFASLGAMAALQALRTRDMRDAFTLGLCGGTAAMLKPTGACVAAAFFVAIVFSELSWREVFRLAIAAMLGLSIPIACAVAYLIASDTLGQIPAVYREISTYASNSAWDWRSDFGKPLVILMLGGFPMFVRGWIGRRHAHRDRAVDRARLPSMLIFLFAWLALELVGVIAQRRMYGYHFLVLAAPLALLFGWLPRRATARSMTMALMPVTLLSLQGTYRIFADEGVKPQTLAVSEYLRAHATSGDAVWSDSASRVLLETGLKPGSRCVLTFLFANSDRAPLKYSDMILSDFTKSPPRFIVLDADIAEYVHHQATHVLEYERFPARRENFCIAWDRIEQFVRQNYTVDVRIGKENVWRLRDDAVAKNRVRSEPFASTSE